jgi:uncharacterized protein YukE
MDKVTIQDLIADWRLRRSILDREIACWKGGSGVVHTHRMKTLRQMARNLNRLIARYAHDA